MSGDTDGRPFLPEDGRWSSPIAVVLVALVLGPALAVGAAGADPTFTVRQGSECTQVTPLGDGTQSVERFYDYRVLNETANYSSLGTRGIQMDQTSQLFVFRGSRGLSLVFLNDAIGSPGGYVATADVSGLPPAGRWVVEDDDYPNRDDVFEYDNTSAHIEWNSNGRRTDGAAFRGLESRNYSTITIDVAFNEETDRYPFDEWRGSPERNRIERWIVRSGTGGTTELDMSRPVELRRGTCGDDAPASIATPTAGGARSTEAAAAGATGGTDAPAPTTERAATPDVSPTVSPVPPTGTTGSRTAEQTAGNDRRTAGLGLGPVVLLVAALLLAATALAVRSG